MRVLVTGATGFVGQWLMRDLEAAGHEAVPTPASSELDITNPSAVTDFVASVRPQAIAHLAGVSYSADAARDPVHAFAVNEGGTRAIIEAAGRLGAVPVLVSGSSDVYGRPAPEDIPLREDAPLRADQPYGRSKVAQEQVALATAAASGVPVIVTRSFNHTGPGQRPEFVAPALARRVVESKRTGVKAISVGNLDVERDIGDVRDVVRAYRILIEGVASGRIPGGTVVNVATGRPVSIRHLLAMISDAAGTEVEPHVDPGLQRPGEAPRIAGDAHRLRTLTGWVPEIELRTTIDDLVASLETAAFAE